MKLASIRDLSKLKEVLQGPGASGPDPAYWVFSEISKDEWANLTVIAPGQYGEEFPKTYGHYHGVNVNETYHLVEGDGVLVMQKKHTENGATVPDKVEEVVLIKARPGDEIIITPEWGHSWSNVGKGPLISFDNWREGHTPGDYEVIEKMQGLAYYLVEENGEIKAVPNPKYKNLPEPKWMTAEEFASLR